MIKSSYAIYFILQILILLFRFIRSDLYSIDNEKYGCVKVIVS